MDVKPKKYPPKNPPALDPPKPLGPHSEWRLAFTNPTESGVSERVYVVLLPWGLGHDYCILYI